MTKIPDQLGVTVVGAGPAGISAALWLRDLDVPFTWFDADGEAGGLVRRIRNPIHNYPGGTYSQGPPLVSMFRDQLDRLDLAPLPVRLSGLDLSGGPPMLTLGEEKRHASRLILATGTRYRTLGVPGESEGLGKWVSQSSMADAHRFAGQPVAVVGGGDAAYENALRLADHRCSVSLLLRSEPRARPEFQRRVEDSTRIRVFSIPTRVAAIEPTVRGCVLRLDTAGHQEPIDVAGVFVRIGVEPCLAPGLQDLHADRQGYLIVDAQGRTSHRQVFAVGDVTSTTLRSIATAVGQGALAARTCAADLNFL